MKIRFYRDPENGEPHIYGHDVREIEVEEVLRKPGEDRPGSDGSRVAMGNVERLLELPHCRLIREGDRFWHCYRSIADAVVVRANLVPDAHIAALLLEHDVQTLYTRDRDFDRFAGVTRVDPFE